MAGPKARSSPTNTSSGRKEKGRHPTRQWQDNRHEAVATTLADVPGPRPSPQPNNAPWRENTRGHHSIHAGSRKSTGREVGAYRVLSTARSNRVRIGVVLRKNRFAFLLLQDIFKSFGRKRKMSHDTYYYLTLPRPSKTKVSLSKYISIFIPLVCLLLSCTPFQEDQGYS